MRIHLHSEICQATTEGGSCRSFILAMTFSLSFLIVNAPAWAQRNLKEIPPTDPELERKSFLVADGFEVNLYAADPKLAKPIQMNFDPQGRLWVSSSSVYPHIKPGQAAEDKVLILEDVDGDGVAEKTTVFAEGLLIPTGVEPGDGGAYVANSTELLHLRDTNGDGKADERRIVLSGFGTEDTHHILHTLRWGPAGMLYMNQSIYIHSHIETPYGVRRLNAGGIWQFRPETMQLEVFARGFYNTWGHHFDAWGQSFATDGAHGEGITTIVPGASYSAAFQASRILHGLNPGSPKHCGLEIVSGRHLPDDWQGNILTNDFRGHRVCRFVVTEDGSGYASREMEELIKTKHVAFRPIDIKMGPDGAIYIADWYNPIIQHGEVDFRDERRDHTHGRIWRVTYRDRPLVERPKLVKAATSELLEFLKSPEGWTRQNAKRVLKERGAKEVVPNLAKWANELDPTDPLFERNRLEALWTYQSLNVPELSLLNSLLNSSDHRIRAAATRVVLHWRDEIPNVIEILGGLAVDEHPRARLEAVRALGSIPEPNSIRAALQALDYPIDTNLDYSLWLTARELSSVWLPEVQAGRIDIVGNAKHLTFALDAVGSTSIVPVLRRLLNDETLPADQQKPIVELIASLGGPADLRRVFELAVGGSSDTNRQAALLRILAASSQKRKVVPEGDLNSLGKLLQSKEPAGQAVAIECAGLWKVVSMNGELVKLAKDDSTRLPVRKLAISAIARLGGNQNRDFLIKISELEAEREVRVAAIVALAAIDLEIAASHAVKMLSATSLQEADSIEAAEMLFASFLREKQGAATLEKAVLKTKLHEDVAKVGLRAIDSSGRKLPTLADALVKAGGITKGPRSLSPEELQQLVSEVNEHGNAANGEAVFRRRDLSCLKCHAIGGAGGRVGPDLVSLGASAQVDYLIESLLDPNKKVKENYHTLVVATDEGKVISGIKVRQSDKELILRDAQDREVAIPLDLIDEKAVGASIMPAGLTEKVTRTELVDLIRFLSELGKLGKFAVSKAPIVRRWRALDVTPEAMYRLRRTRHSTTASDDPAYNWSPLYTNVAGMLPLAELPRFQSRQQRVANHPGTAFVRFELAVTTSGKANLLFNSNRGLKMWVGTTPVEVQSETVIELKTGRQRVTLAIDLNARGQGLQIELAKVAGSSAKAQIIAGK